MPNPEPFPEPKPSPEAKTDITVVGIVEAGVEHGCTLLRTADQVYQLVGSADAMIRPGARLAVRGRPRPTLLTTCQQGVPFQVVEVRAA
jgi:hypothetical protein